MPTFISKKLKILARDDSSVSGRLFHEPNHQLKDFIQSVLAEVDIQINGDRPWDMKVHNENLALLN